MAKYKVTLYDFNTQEIQTSFVTENVPYPGMIINHGGDEWELVRVRQHIRGDNTPAAIQNAPHLIDCLVRKIDGFFG